MAVPLFFPPLNASRTHASHVTTRGRTRASFLVPNAAPSIGRAGRDEATKTGRRLVGRPRGLRQLSSVGWAAAHER